MVWQVGEFEFKKLKNGEDLRNQFGILSRETRERKTISVATAIVQALCVHRYGREGDEELIFV